MNQCPIEHHDQQKVKYICIDQKCAHQTRLGCADCFLENHTSMNPSTHSHQRVQISKFEEDLNNKIENVKNISVEPISNDSTQFDENFNICLNQIVTKLNCFKDELKKEVDTDIQEFEGQVSEFKNLTKNSIQSVAISENQSIGALSSEELDKAIAFYQDSDQIQAVLKKQIDIIESHRDKVQQKKQKVTQKLYSAVDQMLRELDELSNKKPTQLNEIHGTPEKVNVPQTTLFLSGSSNTQSPPIKNLIDAARSKKIQLSQPQQQKKPIKSQKN